MLSHRLLVLRPKTPAQRCSRGSTSQVQPSNHGDNQNYCNGKRNQSGIHQLFQIHRDLPASNTPNHHSIAQSLTSVCAFENTGGLRGHFFTDSRLAVS
jgi:hypothetical protein